MAKTKVEYDILISCPGDVFEEIKTIENTVKKFNDTYSDIQELTPEILLTFVSKIVIHERSKKRSKSATQRIDIYFTHIGNTYAI